MYFQITYCMRNEDTRIFSHLPVTHMVTTDRKEAEKWFDAAVKKAQKSHFNKLISVEDKKPNCMCSLKEAQFECGEPGYVKGRFLIYLTCYSHNPMSDN